jgi:GAF domain-containing protein
LSNFAEAPKKAGKAAAGGPEKSAAAVLFELTDRLFRAETPDEIYAAALDAIIDALGCDRASVLLFDDADVMQFVAARGLSAGYCEAV